MLVISQPKGAAQRTLAVMMIAAVLLIGVICLGVQPAQGEYCQNTYGPWWCNNHVWTREHCQRCFLYGQWEDWVCWDEQATSCWL